MRRVAVRLGAQQALERVLDGLALARRRMRVGDAHGHARPGGRAQREDRERVDVGVDDGPTLVREQALQAPHVSEEALVRRNHEHPAAERPDLLARHERGVLVHEEVELHAAPVDMPVVVHDHGLDAAAAHLAHNMRYADRLTHLPVLPFPNMIENVLRNTFASIAREAFLT